MITYETHYQINERLKEEVTNLYPQIFESFNKEKFFKKFSYHSQFILLIAYEDNELVGFKFGYGQDPDLFYSWTGGVHPKHRKKGIASELMRRQHEWCKQKGFSVIETRTRNKFPEMIALNMKFQFQIIGTFTDRDKEPKIILRKNLL